MRRRFCNTAAFALLVIGISSEVGEGLTHRPTISDRRRVSRSPPLFVSSQSNSGSGAASPCQIFENEGQPAQVTMSRRRWVVDSSAAVVAGWANGCWTSTARAIDDAAVVEPAATTVSNNAAALVSLPSNDEVAKLFNEGRALESQGNLAAAQRIYRKVTALRPSFIYGWSNLGNTQTAFGELPDAEVSYTTAIDLCQQNVRDKADSPTFGVKRCDDLYVLLLNRGCLRLNTGRPKDALADLQLSSTLRGRPDAIVLQNLARAQELNGLYAASDANYDLAISMTANEVNPYWLRSALVKYQLGDERGGYDLLQRVSNRFPEAPEVRAALSVFLWQVKGDPAAAQQKFLEIPDRARLKYSDKQYLTQTVAWPPAMIATLSKITAAVGDTTQ